ncbi:hypothetical protein [Aliamphritea hakodatensis]|uniref:hypothetical protein n=1 Tax=Aliamphritea hakodatensis TaxID=2895352 RepID=UPI0022FD63C8|nr:hypothetical protein [Aliamphritea hakodatensis]
MQVYLVGGAVRDKLLGYPVYDRDWVVVGASPEIMLQQGFRPVGQDFPVFIHKDSGEEYALARTERKSGKGYTGFQYHASPDVTLEEDLLRRDLTINAMAESADGQIIDPYNGQQDLQQRILRHVSPAFAEDPLRVLRVARFAARYAHLGFTLAPETLALMQQLASSDELEFLTPERVWQEMQRALGEQSPQTFFRILEDSHANGKLFPELPIRPAELLLLNTSASAEVRCALLLLKTATDASVIKTFSERQRLPNLFRDLALQLFRGADDLLNFPHLTSDARLQLILDLDLLRRPERLHNLFTACRILNDQQALAAEVQLPDLLTQLGSITPREIMAEGFKGKALGEEIRRRQLTICEQASHPQGQ